jgi:dynactin complex subunit
MICTEFLRVVKEASRIYEATNKQVGMFVTLNLGGSITVGRIVSRKVYKERIFSFLENFGSKLGQKFEDAAPEVVNALENIHKAVDEGVDNDLGNKIYLLDATTYTGNYKFEASTLVISADAVQAWTLSESTQEKGVAIAAKNTEMLFSAT